VKYRAVEASSKKKKRGKGAKGRWASNKDDELLPGVTDGPRCVTILRPESLDSARLRRPSTSRREETEGKKKKKDKRRVRETKMQ